MATPRPDLFRDEAIDAYRAGSPAAGDVLRVPPAWIRRSYWLLLAVVAAAVPYLLFGTVHEYATGPAVIRAEVRLDLTAPHGGTVASIDVRPGQRVAAGDVLVRLHAADESAVLDRLAREIELQIVEVLRHPGNEPARQALMRLRADETLAQARLEEGTIRAPRAGIVRDVRIRPGQPLEPGQGLLSLVDEAGGFAVIALLPGHYRPLLRRGTPVRLELAGYRYAYQEVTVDTIGDELVGPGEVRRYLGEAVADAVALEGPTVIVRATLRAATFEADGQALQYYDGMHGVAEARVREESILLTLVPGLRALLGHAGA